MTTVRIYTIITVIFSIMVMNWAVGCNSGDAAADGDQENSDNWQPNVCEDFCKDACLMLDQCVPDGYISPDFVEVCSHSCNLVPAGLSKRIIGCGEKHTCAEFKACLDNGGISGFDCAWETDNILIDGDIDNPDADGDRTDDDADISTDGDTPDTDGDDETDGDSDGEVTDGDEDTDGDDETDGDTDGDEDTDGDDETDGDTDGDEDTDGDDETDGDTDGDVTDGDDETDGDTDGDVTDGDDETDGDTDGDVTDGDDETDGDTDGDVTDGDDETDGDTDGDLADGDDETDGDTDGDVTDGDDEIDGDTDGDVTDGDDEIEVEAEPEEEIDTGLTCADFWIECDDSFDHNNDQDGEVRFTNYPYCQGMERAAEVIYRFTAPDDCEVTASIGNLSADLDMFLLSGCDRNTCLDYSATTGPESLTFEVPAGEDRFIVVDGFQDAAGDYTIFLDCTCGIEIDGDTDEDITDGDDLTDGDTDGDVTDGDDEPDVFEEELEPEIVDGDDEPEAEIEQEIEPETEPEIEEIVEEEIDDQGCHGSCTDAIDANFCTDTSSLCICDNLIDEWVDVDCDSICTDGGYSGAVRCSANADQTEDICYCYNGECWEDSDCEAIGKNFCAYNESLGRTYCLEGECMSDADCRAIGMDLCIRENDGTTVCLEECPLNTCSPTIPCMDLSNGGSSDGLCADDSAFPCLIPLPIGLCLDTSQTCVEFTSGDSYCWDSCTAFPNTCPSGETCTAIVNQSGEIVAGGCVN